MRTCTGFCCLVRRFACAQKNKSEASSDSQFLFIRKVYIGARFRVTPSGIALWIADSVYFNISFKKNEKNKLCLHRVAPSRLIEIKHFTFGYSRDDKKKSAGEN